MAASNSGFTCSHVPRGRNSLVSVTVRLSCVSSHRQSMAQPTRPCVASSLNFCTCPLVRSRSPQEPAAGANACAWQVSVLRTSGGSPHLTRTTNARASGQTAERSTRQLKDRATPVHQPGSLAPIAAGVVRDRGHAVVDTKGEATRAGVPHVPLGESPAHSRLTPRRSSGGNGGFRPRRSSRQHVALLRAVPY